MNPDLDDIESKAKAYVQCGAPSLPLPTATILALVAECRRSRQQRREHAAMTALLRLASKPDWNVYSIDTDNWYAMENPPFGQLHREETAEELAVKLGVLEPKEDT